jgi:hypothetical protein
MQARPIERSDCNTLGENMCTLGTAQVMEQGEGDEEEEYQEFWDHLGEGEIQKNEDADGGFIDPETINRGNSATAPDGGPEPTEENPVLFQINWVGKKRTLTRVPLSKSSLNEGDSFILCAGSAKVWCWHGRGVRTILWNIVRCYFVKVSNNPTPPHFYIYFSQGPLKGLIVIQLVKICAL